jgi:hypothetical protein
MTPPRWAKARTWPSRKDSVSHAAYSHPKVRPENGRYKRNFHAFCASATFLSSRPVVFRRSAS